ncbi:transglycosylase domain-containing protein [Actinomadura bangladeshensis]|uniref:Penicillin-binding protein n=1 Tax=Actinomadura bangladeshensis TaxID=453573 RepID=A0A4R4NU54_9ACTN|nr:transglycosylase domain-containing protein [Actinomadura bangladeshensis]TDC11583.1 penicillin-binding protein [Actinomadura bangladeshensis]
MHSLPRARRVRPALSRLLRFIPSRLIRPIPPGWRPGRRLIVIILTPVVLTAAATVVAYLRTPLPTQPQDGVTDEGSTVYYADGRTPLFRLGANREAVRHDQIPDRLRWAVLAAEDRGFYGDHGVSPTGTFRALWNNVAGGDTQGGSTITQQLARNYFKGLSRDRTMQRKAKEIFIALKLDRSRAKDEILDLYLNTIYFGRQTSGVQAAARAYFDKDVWQLDVAQCALLAAMIQRPTYFKTQGDDAAARALRSRWAYVLDGMVSMGRLSRADAGRQRFPRTQDEWTGVGLSGQDLLVRHRVETELASVGIPMDSVVNGRLKIYTGLDQHWMRYAERAMRGAREPEWPRTVHGGLVAVDSRTGAVRAFYGGDPKRSQVDSVFAPVAQAGSTFKPYVLAAMLRKGLSVRTKVSGASPQKFAPNGDVTPMTAPGYKVENDEEIGSLGTIDMVEATALSVNTGYVKAALKVGIANVMETARLFGVPESALKPFAGQAGIALGIPDVSAATQAAGYAAFANGGTAVVPHLVTKVVDAKGRRVPLPWDGPGRRVLDGEQAAQATAAMRATVLKGTGRLAALPGREAAGKTGTTEHNRAAWFVGYVPQVSTAVVVGNAQPAALRNLPGFTGTVAGENVPAAIWHAFMEQLPSGLPAEVFPRPVFRGTAADWTDPAPAARNTTPPDSAGPGRKKTPPSGGEPGTGATPGTGGDPRSLPENPDGGPRPTGKVRTTDGARSGAG